MACQYFTRGFVSRGKYETPSDVGMAGQGGDSLGATIAVKVLGGYCPLMEHRGAAALHVADAGTIEPVALDPGLDGVGVQPAAQGLMSRWPVSMGLRRRPAPLRTATV
jgi:hypothetical protein